MRQLAGALPGSAQLYDLDLGGARDSEVWEAARRGGFILVTKDEDIRRWGARRRRLSLLGGYR